MLYLVQSCFSDKPDNRQALHRQKSQMFSNPCQGTGSLGEVRHPVTARQPHQLLIEKPDRYSYNFVEKQDEN